MHNFVIGATGYIGGHVARALIASGGRVSGVARDARGVAKLEAIGVTPVRADTADPDSLVAAARTADATIFAAQLPSQEQENAAVAKLLDTLAGSGKTFVFTSGTGVLAQRTDGAWSEDSFAEHDPFVPSKYTLQRLATEELVRAAAMRGVRAMVVRPPMVWGAGYYGAVDRILGSIEATGAACYVGAGLNLYTHVHVADLAALYRLTLECGVAGALYHAAGGELNYRTIAELVARRHGVPTRSVTPSEAIEIWDKFAMLVVLAASSRSRSPRARAELGWAPTHLDLFDQILTGTLESRQRS